MSMASLDDYPNLIENTDQDRCKECNAFVSKGELEGNAYRYECWRCGWVLEFARD